MANNFTKSYKKTRNFSQNKFCLINQVLKKINKCTIQSGPKIKNATLLYTILQVENVIDSLINF